MRIACWRSESSFRIALCVYNRETIIANNLESKAQEKRDDRGTERQANGILSVTISIFTCPNRWYAALQKNPISTSIWA